MYKSIGVENVSQINIICSFLGNKVLSGNIDAVKCLYGTVWKEHSALIKTISLLQERLTAVEIESDICGIYSNNFLYYWGMTCLGEQSRLIFKDLGTAEICLTETLKAIPKAKARLAYIGLLKSDEPANSDHNIKRIDELRRWAGMQDLFSRIVLAKICFYQFLNERQIDDAELPIRVLRLLELPCQKGHPVAIRFWNEMLAYIGTSEAINMRIDEMCINEGILYDI